MSCTSMIHFKKDNIKLCLLHIVSLYIIYKHHAIKINEYITCIKNKSETKCKCKTPKSMQEKMFLEAIFPLRLVTTALQMNKITTVDVTTCTCISS